MKRLIPIVLLAMLGGCASGNYVKYADDSAKIATATAKRDADIATAKAKSDASRHKSIADIAAAGDSTAKGMGIMALMMESVLASKDDGKSTATAQLQAPQPSGLLQWMQVLAPGLTNLGMAAINASVAKVQSNNSTALGMSTNSTFLGMAGHIQAPAANVSTVTTTSNSDSRVTDNSVRNRTDNSQRTADSGNTTTSTATTSTWGANSGANSGNSGRLAGTSMTDNTSTPTVVMQPAPQPPIVIPPTPPVIVNPLVVNPVIVPAQ